MPDADRMDPHQLLRLAAHSAQMAVDELRDAGTFVGAFVADQLPGQQDLDSIAEELRAVVASLEALTARIHTARQRLVPSSGGTYQAAEGGAHA